MLKPILTPEDYLKIERAAEFKSEYYGGEMFAMSGARRAHNLIAINIGSGLHSQLRRRPCETYESDLRVLVSTSGLDTYPDIVVACGEPQFADDAMDILVNPTLLVEVLSSGKRTMAVEFGCGTRGGGGTGKHRMPPAGWRHLREGAVRF